MMACHCPHCDLDFDGPGLLDQHIGNDHRCGKCGALSADLAAHMAEHDQGAPSVWDAPVDERPDAVFARLHASMVLAIAELPISTYRAQAFIMLESARLHFEEGVRRLGAKS